MPSSLTVRPILPHVHLPRHREASHASQRPYTVTLSDPADTQDRIVRRVACPDHAAALTKLLNDKVVRLWEGLPRPWPLYYAMVQEKYDRDDRDEEGETGHGK